MQCMHDVEIARAVVSYIFFIKKILLGVVIARFAYRVVGNYVERRVLSA